MAVATDIIEELSWRGLIAQSTDLGSLADHCRTARRTVYCGLDPTAPSLHFGSLLQLLTLRRFQLSGHRPLGLVGGATGLIGDPKMAGERTLNDEGVIAGWVERITGQVERYLDIDDSPTGAKVVNNLDWTSKLSAIELLRGIGKNFSVNRMLDREAVAARLAGPGISYTEFSYQLLQANDYLELFGRFDCTLQTGGSDQWGNIVAGVDLVRRTKGTHVHALTTPLIVKADGTKFGKTEGGTVWLDPALTSPYGFYQFCINVEDALVSPLLRQLTFRTQEEIEDLEQATRERPQARTGQRALATDLTALVHGADELRRVEAASKALFGQGDLTELDAKTLGAALAEAPQVTLPAGSLPQLADLFAETELVPSKSAARRAIKEGGAYLNNVRLADPEGIAGEADLLHGRWLVLRRGKRHFASVEVV